MKTSLVIRGIGLITPLGGDVRSTWDALLAGAFITDHSRVHLPPEIWGQPDGPQNHMGRINFIGSIAASEALQSALPDRPLREALSDDRTALVVGSSRGPVDDWVEHPDLSPPGLGFGTSTIAGRLARMFGHGYGPRLTYCAACASGLHALIRAATLIEQGAADRALVVAAESSRHPIFLESFRRLGVVVPEGGRCRPFDVNRQGILTTEAAAAVMIERTESPRAGDVVLDRYAFAGDAGHLTGFDPDAATIRRMLAAAVDGRAVDVIHAHGTGTVANDAVEAAVIDAVMSGIGPSRDCGAAVPPSGSRDGCAANVKPAVYSHKGAIGHSLGASGLVSVVLNVVMHRQAIVPPNVSLESPMPLAHATLTRDLHRRPITRSVACAAGFGGATAAVGLMTVG